MRRDRLLPCLATLALVMACLPTVGRPPVPNTDPFLVNTLIAQTANAAATRTAAALPTFTPTMTFTSTPRNTETASPTPTKPFVFILPGATSLLPSTQTGLSAGTSNSTYGCQVISVEPMNGTVFAPRTDFIATWAVKNIGKSTWYRATMDYAYASGDRLHKITSYDIPKGAETGKNVVLPVDMETPKNGGTYTTTWALVVDNFYFCPLTLTIIVQ